MSSYSFVPSLQCLAATKIVTLVWNGADVIAEVAERCYCYSEEWRWRVMEQKVFQKVSQLPLPAPLKEKTSGFVRLIGDQISKWKITHNRHLYFEETPREFRWTSLGTLDKKGTAEAFVCDPTLPEGERYTMACLYCLEWDGPVPFHPTESGDAFLAYWTYDRTGDEAGLRYQLAEDLSESPYQSAFRFAVRHGNEVAAEYYLNKLSAGEKEQSLSDDTLDPYSTDFGVYRFLLTQMDEGQRSRLLETRAVEVLRSLLEYPWQQFFLDVAHRVRDNLDDQEYSDLLSSIARKTEDGYEDCDYRELFGRVWAQIPQNRKKDMRGWSLRGHSLLSHLLLRKDEKGISMILEEASQEEKENIALSVGGVDICVKLAYRNEWNLLEFFIGKCLLTREKMIEFREKCEEWKELFSDSAAYFRFLDVLTERCSENSGGEEAECAVSEQLDGRAGFVRGRLSVNVVSDNK